VRLPALHVITDDAVLARPGFIDTARALLGLAGPDVALHVRGPGTAARALLARTAALVPEARRAGALLLVNDRIDVALAADADGVQLGERSLGVRDARRLVGGRWIGRSVHDAAAAVRAVADGTDFLVLGTIYATPSHVGRPGAGPDAVRAVVARVHRPVLAIGGITPDRVAAVVAAGAAGVAVQRAVWDAPGTSGLEACLAALRAARPADGPGEEGST
jgi:thiamine-phosphate pyrophosphorylase